jgi:hypothetical protein
VTIIKTTDHGIAHEYIELYNISGGDLDMRWVRTVPPTWPTEWWGANYGDPDNYYADLIDQDSADFVLTDPVELGNKLIIGVTHNAYAANSVMKVTVFPIADRADSLVLIYNIFINQGDAYASLEGVEGTQPSFYYNAVNSELIFSNLPDGTSEISIYDLGGKLVLQDQTNGEKRSIGDQLKAGMYVVELKMANNELVRQKIVL